MPAKRETLKTESVRMRISSEVKQQIHARAAERNLSMTEYLIKAGLGRATRDRADVDAINLLSECSQTLKAIHHALQGSPCTVETISSETMEAQMAYISAAIQRVWNGGRDE